MSPNDSDRIVRCAIHPSIGIARVGNAPKDFFIAPEVPGQAPDPGAPGFKTAKGEVKREGVRFRVYGYDAEGRVVREITSGDADDTEIHWQVHLANRKAAWYQFNNALDLKQYAMSSTYRNASIGGAYRNELVIDPGAREISGPDRHGPRYRFDQGYINFNTGNGPHQVPLGELRTDERGRLIVLGGFGKSASDSGAQATTFANNDGWYDDVSDGPVRARVKLADGREMDAAPAMVAVTPPNFGQGLYGPVTMYDVVYDLFLRHGWIAAPAQLTFWEHIFPIFERLVGNQWVNEGVFFLFGAGSPSDLTDPAVLGRLSDSGAGSREERERLFRWFRQPPPPWDTPGKRAVLPPPRHAKLPPFYGDGIDYGWTTIYDLALTTTQYEWLRRWAEGDFVPGERREPPRSLAEIPLEEQPAALDRTPLENCLGGPFHPGIELTWPMRVPSMWQEPDPLPFRLNILPPGTDPEDDCGTFLTPEIALAAGGPCSASGPGTLTRWMGVPWQTDEASCLNGYDTSYYLPLPSFWAARVPNEVLSMESFERLGAAGLSGLQRTKHLAYRQFWLRDLIKGAGASYQGRINNMVKQWNLLGIVAEQPAPEAAAAPEESPDWPRKYWVETQRSLTYTAKDPTWRQMLRAEHAIAEDEAAAPQSALFESVAPAEAPQEEPQHPVRRDER
jgi:hypothetical protein